jgi:hypothetical protein
MVVVLVCLEVIDEVFNPLLEFLAHDVEKQAGKSDSEAIRLAYKLCMANWRRRIERARRDDSEYTKISSNGQELAEMRQSEVLGYLVG